MIMKNTKNIQTVSKGYRLKPSTHNLIKKIQSHLSSTQDRVISSAMKLYYIQVKENIINKI